MTDQYAATELAYKNGYDAAEKTLSKLQRENIQLRAENNRLEIEVNNYRISLGTFAEENYALSVELKKLRAERDAAVTDLRSQRCDVCTHKYNGEICADCLIHTDRFEWRGVQHEV